VVDCIRESTAAADAGFGQPVASPPPLTATARLPVTPAVVVTLPPRPALLESKTIAAAWTGALPRAAARVSAVMARGPSPVLVVAPPTPPERPLTAVVARLPVAEPPPTPSLASRPPAANLAGGFSVARQLGLSVTRVVIDPGHGGHDPGATGRGLTEAELVLDIALRLEKLLTAKLGMEVILTRRTDEFVPLEERTAIANREGADLFLSIHANASGNVQARGVETYFLNFATNRTAAAVAARENAASGQAMAALQDLVKAIALNTKVDESRDLATYVQRSMVERLRTSNKTLKDLGVKQAPFVVLIGAGMPSALAEISFVTNSQEARLLKGPTYRQKIAEALMSAIRNYQGSLKAPAPKVTQATTP
jgi:N-acetylmuramoyl-L-alanine amidase